VPTLLYLHWFKLAFDIPAEFSPLPNDDCVVREMQPSDGMSSLIAMLQRVQDCFDQMLWINPVFGIADFLFMHAPDPAPAE
jgi:hypothetical protein